MLCCSPYTQTIPSPDGWRRGYVVIEEWELFWVHCWKHKGLKVVSNGRWKSHIAGSTWNPEHDRISNQECPKHPELLEEATWNFVSIKIQSYCSGKIHLYIPYAWKENFHHCSLSLQANETVFSMCYTGGDIIHVVQTDANGPELG